MQFSATSHTPLHGTKLDLRLWVVAIVPVLAYSKGVSSVALGRMLGGTQKTVWRMSHAVRLMMREVGAALPPYEGTLEVERAHKWACSTPPGGGCGTYRQPVLVAAERGGRVRAALIAVHGVGAVEPFVAIWVAPKTTLVSDEDRAMVAPGKGRAAHQVVIHRAKAFVDPTTGASTPSNLSRRAPNGRGWAYSTASLVPTSNAILTKSYSGGATAHRGSTPGWARAARSATRHDGPQGRSAP